MVAVRKAGLRRRPWSISLMEDQIPGRGLQYGIPAHGGRDGSIPMPQSKVARVLYRISQKGRRYVDNEQNR